MNSTTDYYGAPREDDPRLLRAAQEYLAALEAGQRPDRGAFVARFPDLAGELETYLDALDLFHAAAPATALPTPAAVPSAEPLGDFRIVREIGRGGMGTVYEAVQLSLGRKVALKVLPFASALDTKQLLRFKNEAQAAAQLHHTNIVPVYAVGCERGVHYYAMQLIDGQNLADLIRQLASGGRDLASGGREPPDGSEQSGALRPPLAKSHPPLASTLQAALSTQRASHSGTFYRTVAGLVAQAADALEHAHQLGVIHRDVKPGNLLVDDRGTVWVTDFGLAQFHTSAGLTRTGDLLGTLRYMSPEQAAGQGAPLDARTDVYSLGATLYEMLTLEPMFSGTDPQRLLRQILEDEPRPPRASDRAVPAELETIVLKAVSKNPADRYATARDFADDLRRFVDNRPILARRPTLAQRVRKWGRRHPSVVVAGVVLLILVAIGSLVSAALIGGAYERERKRAEEADARFALAKMSVDEMIQFSKEELSDNPMFQGLRKRLLDSALSYYQEFIDLRRDDPAAQKELRETQAQVEAIVADLAVLEGVGRTQLLRHDPVLDGLDLSAEKRRKIDDMFKRGREKVKSFSRLSSDKRQQSFLELFRAEEKEVNALLSPKEIRRLRQIELQVKGLAAFREPDVVAALKLTAKQREDLRTIEAGVFFGKFSPIGPGFGPSPADDLGPPKGGRGFGPKKGPDDGPREDGPGRGSLKGRGFGKQKGKGPGFGLPPKEDHKDQEKRLAQARESALKVFTPEQARTWQQMTGKPFQGRVPFFLPGGLGPPPLPPEGRDPPDDCPPG
jgi:serine/threonine protein kinase